MSILIELCEGLEMIDHPKGGKVIHYHDDPDHADDPRLDKITSSTHPGYVQTKGSENPLIGGPTSSYDEERELKSAIKNNPGAFQNKLPSYVGFVVEPAPEKSDAAFKNPKIKISSEDKSNIRQYSQPFQDALKNKPNSENLRFDAESKQKYIDKGSEHVVHQMKGHSKFNIDLGNFDQIYVVPMPSSAELSKQFANSLAGELNAQGHKANVTSDFISKKRFPSSALIRSYEKNEPDEIDESVSGITKHDVMPRKSVRYKYDADAKGSLSKLYNVPLSNRSASEDEIRYHVNRQFDIARSNIRDINLKLKSIDTPTNERNRLISARNAFNDVIADEPRIIKNMNDKIRLAKSKGWSGKRENKKSFSIASDYGSRRHSIRDFTKHDENHPHGPKMFDPSKKTLIILADDNVDTGATTDDFYRGLFKKGLVHKNMFFVTAALNKRGTGGRTMRYGTDIHSQKQTHKKTIKASAEKFFNEWKDDPDYMELRDDLVDDLAKSSKVTPKEADEALKSVENDYKKEQDKAEQRKKVKRTKTPRAKPSIKEPSIPYEKISNDTIKAIKRSFRHDQIQRYIDKENDNFAYRGIPEKSKDEIFQMLGKNAINVVNRGEPLDKAINMVLNKLRKNISEAFTFVDYLINE